MSKSNNRNPKRNGSGKRSGGNGRRNNYNNQKVNNKAATVEVEGRQEIATNNPKWYVRRPSTQRAVERVSFSNILGETYPIGDVEQTSAGSSRIISRNLWMPTFLAVYINPAIEPNRAGEDLSYSAINRSSQIAYVAWSSVSGRTRQYTSGDISTYILAIGSIMALISHIRRAIGLTRYYSSRNMTFPKQVMEAMKISLTDIAEQDVLNWIDNLNYEIRSLNSLKFPMNLPYFEKWSSIFDRVYKDSENELSQDFAFVPWSLWKLNEKYSEQGTGLDTVLIAGRSTAPTIPIMINLLHSMIQAVLNSDTQQLIGSDLLNYARKENMQLGGIPELDYAYMVAPEYSAEACLHLHHAKPIGEPTRTETINGYTPFTKLNDVAPDIEHAGMVNYCPMFPYSAGSQINPVFDIDSNDPNLDEIVESRRFMALLTGTKHTDGSTEWLSATSGYFTDNYVVKMLLYGMLNDEVGGLRTLSNTNNFIESTAQTVSTLVWLSNFNHGPILPWIQNNGGVTFFCPAENLAEVPTSYLSRVNHLEQLDLFTIAELERFMQ